MNADARYTLARGEERYGPYTLDHLREYLEQGSIRPSDLVWSEGMPTWRPASEVVEGSAAADVPPLPPAAGEATPKPPNLPWALVLVLTLLTCFIFGVVWAFVQAIWVKRIDSTSKAVWILAVGLSVQVIMAIASTTSVEYEQGRDVLGTLIGAVTAIWAYFDMRASIEARFDLDLSGLMTFFFNIFYLQYHMSRMARGEHTPRAQRILQ